MHTVIILNKQSSDLLKDFRFLRKVLGSQQIDNLIAQAKDMEQQRKQNQRTRRRNTNYER